jgi:hypothetical protein
MSLVDSVAPAAALPYQALVLPYLPLNLGTLIEEAAVQRMGEAAARGALPVPAYTTWEVCEWVKMMAAGLAFLRFTCRISHGDLAPRNVLIAGPNKDGVVSGYRHMLSALECVYRGPVPLPPFPNPSGRSSWRTSGWPTGST